ncbi:MAG: hypothetical protein ACRDVE_08600 [Actinocrinis sp.]
MSSFPIPEGIDPDAWIRRWTPGAEAGDEVAMCGLCTAHVMKQDWEAAEPWARRLLDGRLSLFGMRALAEIQEQRGEQAEAQEWNRRADEAYSRMPAGFPMERLVGPMTERFGDVPDLEVVRAAAEAGDVTAMTALGMMLQTDPLGSDPSQAVRWLTPGAEAGDPLAIVVLCAALGELGDDDGAAHWLDVATERGLLRDFLGDFGTAPTGDEDETRHWPDETPQARAEEDETGADH